MLILFCIEQVFSEHVLAGDEPKAIRARHGGPKAVPPADGAIAAIRGLAQIELGLEPDGAAVTTALVGF
jgi:hypothetical protein